MKTGLTASNPRRSRREAALRIAAAITLSGLLALVALSAGQSGARAQAASVGTGEASVAPASAVLYFGISLDTGSAQWKIANGLFAKLGIANGAAGVLDQITSTTTIAGSGQTVDTSSLLGGEAAVVVTSLQGASSTVSGLSSLTGGLGLNLGSSVESSAATVVAGDISAVSSPAAEPPAAAGSAVVIKPSDLAEATKTVNDAMSAAAAALGVQVTQTTYKGVTISSYPGDASTGEAGAASATVGDFVVLADTPADIEPIVDTAKGDAKAIADDASFKKADAALAGDRLGFGMLNGTAMANGASALDATTAGLLGSFGGVLGTDRATGLAVIADPAGFRLNTVDLPYDGKPAAAGGKAADLSMAAKVPANSLLYVNGYNIGQGPLLQGIALYLVSTLNSALSSVVTGTPAATPSPDALFTTGAQLLGFNLKTDFIDQLIGEYAFAIWNVDLTNPAGIGMLLASNTKTPAQVSDSLSKLSLVIQAAVSGQANVTSDTSSGSLISKVTIGNGTTAAGGSIDYGVVDGKLLLGLNDSIKSYLAGFDGSLADSAGYKAGLAALPKEYDGIFYVNLQQAMTLSNALGNLGSAGGQLDNSPSCAKYATQADAQAAYDADSVTNYDLDLNFNGTACEDFFAPASPTPGASGGQYAALSSFTMVSYKKDGLGYTSSILLVGGE